MARIDYEAVAPAYDRARALASEGLGEWRAAVAPYVHEAPDRRLLDIGAGTGVFAHAFAEWFGVRVVAVDPSTAMLDVARRTRPHASIEYVEGDAAHLPISDGSAALAWLSTVVHHIPDLRAAANAMRAAVRDGGPVLIRGAFPSRLDGITLFRYFPSGRRILATYPSVDAVADAFRTAGFELETLRGVTQTSSPSLAVFLASVRLRADTVLRGISDDEFEAGLRAIEADVAGGAESPVVDTLDLLVLR